MSTETTVRPWLSEGEVRDLCGYMRPKLQRKALAEMGIDSRRRPADGATIVMRSSLDHRPPERPARKPRQATGPNLSAIA